MSADPAPSFSQTYRRADKESICDYGWVTDLDYFDEDDYPVELIRETWTRTGVEVFWHFPDRLYGCELPDCDEDAVGWRREVGGEWSQACAKHGGATE